MVARRAVEVRCLRAVWACVSLACAWVMVAPGQAQAAQDRLYVAGGGEAWVSPEAGGHGFALVHYQRDAVVQQAQLNLFYNTDTLFAGLDGLRLGEHLRAGGFIKGQVGFGGLLPDYYQRGEFVEGRGFAASQAQAVAYLRVVDAPHFLDLAIGGRRWRFDRLGRTNSALVMPLDFWSVEPELRYTYWALKHDAAFSDPHRLSWRIEGLAFGVEVSTQIRSQQRPWGATEASGLEPADRRNRDTGDPLLVRGWARGGVALGQRARVQGMLYVAGGAHEDDITRVRAGGMNPYVVPLSGLPWAAFMPDQLGAAQLSGHIKVGAHELGLSVESLTMSRADALRLSAPRVEDAPAWLPGGGSETLIGLGLFADMRWGAWQLDARAGWALPDEVLARSPHLTVWLALGKQIF